MTLRELIEDFARERQRLLDGILRGRRMLRGEMELNDLLEAAAEAQRKDDRQAEYEELSGHHPMEDCEEEER
jgi:hypothetical protein